MSNICLFLLLLLLRYYLNFLTVNEESNGFGLLIEAM